MRRKLLIAIILFAAVIRLVDLGKNPPSLNWDEVAIGWNAYSILHTGKDEYGKFLPLTFRSFDDYKSPAYIYFTSASILLFGKNDFAVRFPSALFGILTVILIYPVTKKILITDKTDGVWRNRIDNIALFTTFFLAISPWHVHFSHVAFEANVALFWELLGILYFLKWRENKKLRTILIAVVSFGVALYSYANARLLIPLMLFGLAVYFRNQLKTQVKAISLATLVGLLICLPLFMQMYQGEGLARYNATTILGKKVVEIFARNNALAKEDFDAGHGWLSSKVHNFRIPIAQNVVANYLSHFNYSFLFKFADLPRHQVPGFGLFYLWQLPLILIGIIFVIKKREQLNAAISLWWLVIAPIPAALTWQVPHAIRAYFMLPVVTIFSAIGLWVILKYIQTCDLKSYIRPPANNRVKKYQHSFQWAWPKATFILIFMCIAFSVLQYGISYAVHLPAEFSAYWLYGRKEMVHSVVQQESKFDSVTVSLSLDWSYLWFLWYQDISPQEYLSQGGTVSGGFAETQNKVGKIEFHNFDYEKQKKIPNSLMIGSPSDFPGNLVPDEKILDLSGKPIIYIVKS